MDNFDIAEDAANEFADALLDIGGLPAENIAEAMIVTGAALATATWGRPAAVAFLIELAAGIDKNG